MKGRRRRILGVLAGRTLRGLARGGFGLMGVRRLGEALALQARLGFEELGGTFVKLGQLVSVRPDVFPAVLVFEMEKLRDDVPPLAYEVIRRVVERELGRPPEEAFEAFEEAPFASASIAQVHRAVLRERAVPAWGAPLEPGSRVAVKVVRPGVEEALLSDLDSAARTAAFLRRSGPLARVDTARLFSQIEESVRRELDMRVEGRVADRFAFNFRREPTVVVPRVAWRLTQRSVLTMEYIEGWPLSDLEAARRAGVDARRLALEGARAFMKQVLEDGFFHADLHHANLLATRDGRIAYLDFGIHGTLTPAERESVAQVLAALVYRDADRALRHSRDLGVLIRPGREARMRRELGLLMDRTLGPDTGEGGRDIRHFGLGFMGLLKRHGVDIPVGYAQLVKALVTVEGVSRQLYPEIDIVQTARPFVTRLLARSFLRPAVLRKRLPAALRAAAREFLA